MDKFWMCYVEETNNCSHKHYNRTEAIAEAERLLRMPSNANKKVYLLEVVGYAHHEPMPIKWESLN